MRVFGAPVKFRVESGVSVHYQSVMDPDGLVSGIAV
jgi:hypothetical protein